MSRRIIFSMIGAGAMLVSTASDASAFEMLGRMLGGGYYGDPGCGCAAEPSCGCGSSWGGCSSGCGRRHCGLFGGGLFSRHRGCGCDSGCGCAAEPVCGCAAEPVCGCAAEPSCGCASACDSGCGRGRRGCGLFGGGLFSRHRGCGSSCGCAAAAEPVCGCAAEPVCGCAAEPVCGCAG